MARNLKYLHRLSCQYLPLFHTKSQIRTLKICVNFNSKFTATPSNLHSTLNEGTAYELVLNLDESERNALKTALNKLESNDVKQKLEGKFDQNSHDSLNH